MRWAAKKVGQGNPASLFQEVAQACIEETAAASGGSSGSQMVTERCSIAESCRHVFVCCCNAGFVLRPRHQMGFSARQSGQESLQS